MQIFLFCFFSCICGDQIESLNFNLKAQKDSLINAGSLWRKPNTITPDCSRKYCRQGR